MNVGGMDPAEVLTELSRQGLLPVLQAALKRYLRTGHLGRSRPDLSAETWLALSRLTGQNSGQTLDLAVLDAALRRSRYAVGLLAVLEALGTPMVIRRQTRETLEGRWAALLADVPDADWQKALSRDEAGATLLRAELKAGSEADQLVQLVTQALGAARSETLSFPVLAARLSGNAHALDLDTTAGKVFRAALQGLHVPVPLRDGVSSTVLIANIRGPDWLDALAGHCLALPWREVQTLDEVYVAGNRLWVVENPSVFEALHAARPFAPLLCTSGQPKTAAAALLARLPASTTVYLNCDLDLGGLRIAAHLMRSVALDWRPWRMDAAAHALASGRGPAPLKGAAGLAGYAAQFPGLVAALQESGQGAHQENLLPELLADVSACSP